MNSIISAALSHGRTVIMLLLLILIAGSVTYFNIPKEAEPDVPIPIIYVSINHQGIAPEDGERSLLRPLEQELRGLDGLKEMISTASEGHASIQLEFHAGIDGDAALANVREKVSLAKALLPDDSEEPVIKEVTMATQKPALTVILSGDVAERALVTVSRELKHKIEALTEVLEVSVGGDREDMIEILVDPLLMESYNLDQNDIYNLISRNNLLVAAGTLDSGQGRFPIKVPSVFDSLKDVLDLPVKVEGTRVITFGDVAEVRRSYKDPTSFARIDGKAAVALEVKKRPGENIIETVAKVKALVIEDSAYWQGVIKYDFTGDSSKDVKDMLSDLQNNVLSAVLLVVIVIIATLGGRSALLVGISIPGSFLAGILMLSMWGYTINTVVLFALIMAVGMLVDGAIVVTEFADREMNEGKSNKEAYSLAAKRMAWPIIASTATTLAAFAPLLFWPGMMGEFMKFLPLTLITTLSASLLMALIFVPTLGGIFGRSRKLSSLEKKQIQVAEHGDLTRMPGLTGRYIKLLNAAIARPWWCLGGAILFSFLVIKAYGVYGQGSEFFPEIEPPGFNIIVRSQGDLSIYEQDELMKQVEAKLLGMPEIETLYVRTGKSDRNGEQIGSMRVNLVDWQLRRKADVIITDILAKTESLAGLQIEARKDESGPPQGKDLQLEISSRYPELLEPALAKIRAVIATQQIFTNVSDNGTKPGIEWQIKIDRGIAARYGADALLVGNNVQFVTTGLRLGGYRADDVDDEMDIRVRFSDRYRHIDRLENLRLKTASGQVPLSVFSTLTPEQKKDTVRKVDGRQALKVEADLLPGYNLNEELPKLMKLVPGLELDPRVNIRLRGQNENQQESAEFLKNALLIALAVMAIILVTQFNSFYQAFLILTAVIFSTVGVFLGLIIVQEPFGIVMSGIGVIALAGIVVNNNIVLIDTYNVLKQQGLSAVESVLRTGAQRLRPVMLTTVTTILGLMPMVLQMNVDIVNRTTTFGAPSTQWWSQLATAVAGGLTFATVLTLVLTPCMLVIGDRISMRLNKESPAARNISYDGSQHVAYSSEKVDSETMTIKQVE
ncbi:MAG: multidrug efflux pump [Moritella sp.]|jgi:multidrug efflux pump